MAPPCRTKTNGRHPPHPKKTRSSASFGDAQPLELAARLKIFFDLRPGVSQCNRTIEDEAAVCGVGIDAEIALTLKLKAVARIRAGKAGLHKTSIEHLQRIGIQLRGETACFAIRRTLVVEQSVVKTNLCGNGVRCGNPVECGLG